MIVDRFYFQEHRMFWAAAGFANGLVLIQYRGFIWAKLGLLVLIISAMFLRSQNNSKSLLLFFLFCGIGCSYMQAETAMQTEGLSVVEDDIVTVQGIVAEGQKGQPYFWLKATESDAKMLIETDRIYVMQPRSFDAEHEKDDAVLWYPPGSRVLIKGRVILPQGQRNPGGFDEAQWLRSKGAVYKLMAEEITVQQQPTGIWAKVMQLRNDIEQTVYEYLPPQEAGTAMALLLGEKQQLDPAFYRLTQRMGTAHIFAVSGLHVGFVGGMLLFFLRLCNWERSWLAFLCLLAGLSGYCLLTGLLPSAIRATVMILLASLGLCLYRPVSSIDFLAAAALLLLCSNPFLLWSAGFQLSFGVTLSLLLFASPLQTKLRWIPWNWLRSGVAVAIAAFLGSLPLSAWHFYTVSFFSPLFNLLLVPIVSVLVPCLFLFFIAAFIFPVGAVVFVLPAHLFLQLLMVGTTGLSNLMGSGHWYIGRPSVLVMIVYACFFMLICYLLQKRQGYSYKLYGVAAILLIVMIHFSLPAPPDTDELLYLDAGQGSCAVLRTAAGETVIFDGGTQQRELVSCLAWYGVNHVEAIILSHGDTDHISGISQVVETIPVQYLFMEKGQAERETVEELLMMCKNRNTVLAPIAETGTLQLAENQIVLQVYGDSAAGTNGRELTAVVKNASVIAAFPGDLAIAEVREFVEDQKKITVWTVPHHGSRNSADERLYQQLCQKGVKQAIISAGIDNHYGHPHQEVLNFLQQQQIAVYRTDQQGALCLRLAK